MGRICTAHELLRAVAFDHDVALDEAELEKVFWSYKGLELDLSRERSFFAATNEALARAFEDLARSKRELEVARRELEEINATLEQRVADGVAKLRESERMAAYGQLVAGVVHEIRQPLFAIKTVAYLIAQALRDRDEEAHVAILRTESERLDTLMEDLLDFAKPFNLMRSTVPISVLLRDTIAAFRAQAPASRLEVEVSSDDELVAMLDRIRIQQVLINLLHNAHKHASGATRVELVARPGERCVVITVENDGTPIHGDVASRAFEPFFTTGQGTGLGLAIARRIIEAHGGTIAVAPLQIGTRFTLSLPAEALAG